MADSKSNKFLLPLYLFKGNEFGEKNDEIARLKSNARKKFASVEFNTFYATETSVNNIIMQLSNGSLFSDAHFFVIKAAEVIKKKEEIALIENWKNSCIEQQNDSSILVLVSDEVGGKDGVDKKLEAIVPKENVKTFYEMFENKKLPWIKNYFSKNGFRIEDDAAQSILNLVENNTEELKNECSRFFVCFPNDHIINTDDVDKILAHNKEETPFTLFDAMSDSAKTPTQRFENSLEILQKILSSSKNDTAISLIAGLTYSFGQLKKWCIVNSSGRLPESELKSNGFYIKSSWAKYDSACRIWAPKQIQKIISLLANADVDLRSSGKDQSSSILELLLYQIIMKNAGKLAIYE